MKHLLSVCFLLLTLSSGAQGTQLLRQPTVSSSSIVFVYANDLWKVPVTGGEAIRLTSNEGYEFSPHFSPDEKWIAFTAEYDGNYDVYILPAEGGSPKRLTWHSSADVVQGWTPTGEVLFRSSREGQPTQTSKFFTVNAEGGLPTAVDIPRAAFGELSPDGSHIAYVPITFWDPEWRNYRGGQAMPIWIVNMKTKELIRTPQPTKERHLDPVWYGKKVFYLSERDYTNNIWSYDPSTGEEKQHTFHKKFDVKSLDAGSNTIVYEQGGYLHLLDPQTGTIKQLTITVKGDMNFARTRWENVNASALTNPNLSPSGKRAIFEHRGEIFTVPKENGSWRNLTNAPGSAERSPVWSPKGDKILWFSDQSGEYKIILANQQGTLLKTIDIPDPTFYFKPEWSSDGIHIAYTDTHYNIWITNTETGNSKIVATDRYAHPNRSMNPVWSPDGKWIAYSKQLDSHFKAVFAYNAESGNTIQLTDGMADAISPVWDENGKYLYFLASTNYGLNSGWLDMSSYDPDVTRNLYCLVLSKKDTFPVLPKSDEEALSGEEKESATTKSSKKNEDKEKPDSKEAIVVIDQEGLWDRAKALKLEDKNYVALEKAPKEHVFVAEAKPRSNGLTLHLYNVKDEKAKEYATDVNAAVVSEDRKSILLRKGSSWSINDTKTPPKDGKDKLVTNLKIKVAPKDEYRQIFKEGWRFMRDFLYVDNVHGAPWNKIYAWYAPWVDHVRHRTDLNYLVDIMSGEVSIGHSYVSGGDFPDTQRVPVGLLGCDLKEKNGYYQISKIYTGERWNPDVRAPLALPGLDVKEGDYIIAINGTEIKAPVNPYSLLEQTANRTITLEVNSKPSAAGAREILVTPISSEIELRGMAWVENNRRKVEALSNGKLAYVYVPNTSGRGFASFNRYYFAQQDKKGVIIDERNNGGGSAADYMIDIMARKPFGYFNSKAGDKRPWTTPISGIWGPKVMIVNERAGSGGDLLPYMFREAQLGPLVGTRTWGGLVGTWDTPRFIDGGRMVAPRGGFYDNNGKWAVEGEGIEPDIEVIQHPAKVLKGEDPQLERAVEEALNMLKTQTFEIKPEPAPPVRWKRASGYDNE
ncbi:S41 family peptidase [Ascidiimonas aurantiaca]|uniref:S41 family peptidase n=1 Tax=Ascidiimonas aurantiaca TaxID=1685432 RepID=UPI0030ED0E5B